MSLAATFTAWRAWWSHRTGHRAASWAVLGLLVFGPGTYQWVRLSWTQWRLDRQLSVLAAEQDRLTRARGRLQSDPAHVEGLIRSTFKWAKPGEYVIPLDPVARRDAPSSR